MDKALAGTPGRRNFRVNARGVPVIDEIVERPRAGQTVALTINLRWQQAAERVLRGGAYRGGAFVVIDIHTGEILVLASPALLRHQCLGSPPSPRTT